MRGLFERYFEHVDDADINAPLEGQPSRSKCLGVFVGFGVVLARPTLEGALIHVCAGASAVCVLCYRLASAQHWFSATSSNSVFRQT